MAPDSRWYAVASCGWVGSQILDAYILGACSPAPELACTLVPRAGCNTLLLKAVYKSAPACTLVSVDYSILPMVAYKWVSLAVGT